LLVATYERVELAAEVGVVDRIIRPEDTRYELGRILATLAPRSDRAPVLPRWLANMPL